ncbi:hypothetical protein GS937_14550, partial [Rhodococcus hoagii]|nr:hypothetical protein [Prescottella equi]
MASVAGVVMEVYEAASSIVTTPETFTPATRRSAMVLMPGSTPATRAKCLGAGSRTISA